MRIRSGSLRLITWQIMVTALACLLFGSGSLASDQPVTIYYFDKAGRLSRVNSDGTNREVLSERETTVIHPLYFAPGGAGFVYTSRTRLRTKTDLNSLLHYDIASGTEKLLHEFDHRPDIIGWSPDGRYFAFIEGKLWERDAVAKLIVYDIRSERKSRVAYESSLGSHVRSAMFLKNIFIQHEKLKGLGSNEAFWTNGPILMFRVVSLETGEGGGGARSEARSASGV